MDAEKSGEPLSDKDPDIFDLLEDVEQSRASFFEAAQRYKESPSNSHQRELFEYNEDATNSVLEVVDFVLGDDSRDINSKAQTLELLMQVENYRRVQYLQTSTGDKDAFRHSTSNTLSAEKIAKKIEIEEQEHEGDNEDDEFESAADYLESALMIDTRRDLEKLIELTKASFKGRAYNAAEGAKEHVSDVAKVAIGVLIAQMLIRKFKPKSD